MFLPPIAAYVPDIARTAREAPARPVAAVAPVEEAKRRDERAGARFSADELRVLELLRARDRELRLHGPAHVVLGGSLVRAASSYTYERGPDGRYYAVDGELGLTLDTTHLPDPAQAEQAQAAAGGDASEAGQLPAPAAERGLAATVAPAAAAFDRDHAFGLAAARFYHEVAENHGARKALVSLRV
jgi:hypothetical protein